MALSNHYIHSSVSTGTSANRLIQSIYNIPESCENVIVLVFSLLFIYYFIYSNSFHRRPSDVLFVLTNKSEYFQFAEIKNIKLKFTLLCQKPLNKRRKNKIINNKRMFTLYFQSLSDFVPHSTSVCPWTRTASAECSTSGSSPSLTCWSTSGFTQSPWSLAVPRTSRSSASWVPPPFASQVWVTPAHHINKKHKRLDDV